MRKRKQNKVYPELWAKSPELAEELRKAGTKGGSEPAVRALAERASLLLIALLHEAKQPGGFFERHPADDDFICYLETKLQLAPQKLKGLKPGRPAKNAMRDKLLADTVRRLWEGGYTISYACELVAQKLLDGTLGIRDNLTPITIQRIYQKARRKAESDE